MKKDDDEIIGAKEASEILHVSKSYFLQLLKKKSLPIKFIKIGTRAKFRRKDVEDYFESHFSDNYNETKGEGNE